MYQLSTRAGNLVIGRGCGLLSMAANVWMMTQVVIDSNDDDGREFGLPIAALISTSVDGEGHGAKDGTLWSVWWMTWIGSLVGWHKCGATVMTLGSLGSLAVASLGYCCAASVRQEKPDWDGLAVIGYEASRSR